MGEVLENVSVTCTQYLCSMYKVAYGGEGGLECTVTVYIFFLINYNLSPICLYIYICLYPPPPPPPIFSLPLCHQNILIFSLPPPPIFSLPPVPSEYSHLQPPPPPPPIFSLPPHVIRIFQKCNRNSNRCKKVSVYT